MSEDSIMCTAFVTSSGQYEYVKILFALANVLSWFQRYINLLLKYLINQNKVSVYIDNYPITTKTLEDNFSTLNPNLYLFVRSGWKLSLYTCYFSFNELNYFGYSVSTKGFRFNFEESLAFEILKSALISKPNLCIFNPTLQTELHTDSSWNG